MSKKLTKTLKPRFLPSPRLLGKVAYQSAPLPSKLTTFGMCPPRICGLLMYFRLTVICKCVLPRISLLKDSVFYCTSAMDVHLWDKDKVFKNASKCQKLTCIRLHGLRTYMVSWSDEKIILPVFAFWLPYFFGVKVWMLQKKLCDVPLSWVLSYIDVFCFWGNHHITIKKQGRGSCLKFSSSSSMTGGGTKKSQPVIKATLNAVAPEEHFRLTSTHLGK